MRDKEKWRDAGKQREEIRGKMKERRRFDSETNHRKIICMVRGVEKGEKERRTGIDGGRIGEIEKTVRNREGDQENR